MCNGVVGLFWDTQRFHSADVVPVQSRLSLVALCGTKFLKKESQTSPAAAPAMEGIGLSFGLFRFHRKLELSDSCEKSC